MRTKTIDAIHVYSGVPIDVVEIDDGAGLLAVIGKSSIYESVVYEAV